MEMSATTHIHAFSALWWKTLPYDWEKKCQPKGARRQNMLNWHSFGRRPTEIFPTFSQSSGLQINEFILGDTLKQQRPKTTKSKGRYQQVPFVSLTTSTSYFGLEGFAKSSSSLFVARGWTGLGSYDGLLFARPSRGLFSVPLFSSRRAKSGKVC